MKNKEFEEGIYDKQSDGMVLIHQPTAYSNRLIRRRRKTT